MKKRNYRLLFLLLAVLIAGTGQAHTDSVLKGDANGDGQVTIADAVAVTNQIHGNTPANFNATAADINNDGQITIADVVGIINIIHYGSPSGSGNINNGYGEAIPEGDDGWHD